MISTLSRLSIVPRDAHSTDSATPLLATVPAEPAARALSAGTPALITRRAFEAWAAAMVRRRLGCRA